MLNIIRKNLEMYHSFSLPKKSALWYTGASFLQKGLSFITVPIFTRILSETDYGMNSVYQSWLQIVSIIVILGLDRCAAVGMSKYEDRIGFLSSLQLLTTIIVGISFLILAIFRQFFSQLLGLPEYLLFVMIGITLLNASMTNWLYYQRFEYKYKTVAALSLGISLLSPIMSVVLVQISPKEYKAEALILSGTFISAIFYGIIYVKVFFKGKVYFNKNIWKFAFFYSIPIIPHALSGIVLNSSDRIMIDKICGRSEAAYYGVAYNLAMLISTLIWSISNAMMPWLYDKIKKREFKDLSVKTNQILIFMAFLPCLISLFAPEILMILTPPTYQSAIWVVPSVSASVFLNFTYVFFSSVEFYYEKTIYASIATSVGAGLNIGLNFIFIPIFGFVAAGYTTLFCYIIFTVMHYFFMKKVCKEKLDGVEIYNIRFIVRISLAVIFIAVGVTFTYFLPILRYGLFCVIFIGAIESLY